METRHRIQARKKLRLARSLRLNERMLYVYVLHPLRDAGLYIVYSTDLRRRLGEDKRGASHAISYRSPWNLIYNETYTEEAGAAGRAHYLKSGGGRKFLRSQLHNYFANHPVEPREGKPRLCGEAFYFNR